MLQSPVANHGDVVSFGPPTNQTLVLSPPPPAICEADDLRLLCAYTFRVGDDAPPALDRTDGLRTLPPPIPSIADEMSRHLVPGRVEAIDAAGAFKYGG